MESVPTNAWISLVLGGVLVLGGMLWLEPLPPTVSVFYAVPPLAFGIAVWIGATFGNDIGVYGRFLGFLPPAGHATLRFLAAAIVGGSVLWFVKQPGGEAAPLERRLVGVQDACTHRGERAERGLIEVFTGIEEGMAAQTPAGRARSEARLQPVFDRCVEHTRVAFADPQGTHRSWRILRDWLREHPLSGNRDDPLWTAPHQPRLHEPAPRAVELALP